MKFIKKLLLVFTSLIVIILIIALFLNRDFSVKRSVEINKSTAELFDYLKYLKNQDEFSVWAKMDPKMKKSYSGTDGEVGFVSKWDSKNENVGKGEQEIIKISPEKRIDYELRFLKPMEVTNDAYLELEKINTERTKVTWGFEGTMEWPWNFMLLFMNMDEMIGKDLKKGLDNLKIKMEGNNEI